MKSFHKDLLMIYAVFFVSLIIAIWNPHGLLIAFAALGSILVLSGANNNDG